MHRDFSDDLRSSIPEPPSTDGWMPAIRAKRRKRRLAAGGGVAVLAVALAVPLALTVIDRGRTAVPVGPSPSESAEAAVPTPGSTTPPCDDDEGNPVVASPVSDGVVVRAWLCGEQAYGEAGPREPLVQDPQRVVDAFRALPPMPGARCDVGNVLTAQRVVLEYADSAPGVIEIPQATCAEPVTDGAEERQGDSFLDELVGLWQEQRAHSAAPSMGEVTSSLQCGSTQPTMLDPGLPDVVTGVACPMLDDAELPAPTAFPDGLATQLAEALQTEAEARPDDFSPTGSRGTLLLAGAWGDVVVVECWDEGCTFRGDAEMMLWQPSGELADELDAILD